MVARQLLPSDIAKSDKLVNKIVRVPPKKVKVAHLVENNNDNNAMPIKRGRSRIGSSVIKIPVSNEIVDFDGLVQNMNKTKDVVVTETIQTRRGDGIEVHVEEEEELDYDFTEEEAQELAGGESQMSDDSMSKDATTYS